MRNLLLIILITTIITCGIYFGSGGTIANGSSSISLMSLTQIWGYLYLCQENGQFPYVIKLPFSWQHSIHFHIPVAS